MNPNAAMEPRKLLGLGLSYALILALAIFLEAYFIAAIPLVLLVLYFAFFRLDVLMLFIVACTPFSLNLEDLELGGIGFYLPTEPLLFGVLLMVLFKVLSGKFLDEDVLRHPISWLLYTIITWMFLTSITSEIPLVSFKFLLSKLWFIVPVYFLGTQLLKNQSRIRFFLLSYLFALIIVVLYTILHHASYGFGMEAGHWVMSPFFKDHTSYGAVLAMFFPVALGMLFQKNVSALLKVFLLIAFVILCAGIILSYTRAAWVSIAAAAGLLVLLLFRVKLLTLISSGLILAAFLFSIQDQLLIKLERNTQDSSDDLAEHVESISNVSSDASNLERLNRWNCALAMFIERPLMGWGPGTYQFVYAPFQNSQDLTIISTNNADGGNAHSEYLGPLAEQGVAGMLLMITLVLMVSALAFRLFYSLESYELKIVVVSTYLGLVTYFIHGILNNYLDTDKAAIPFWGFIAILVSIDVVSKSEKAATE
jgi:O-antigen ligase